MKRVAAIAVLALLGVSVTVPAWAQGMWRMGAQAILENHKVDVKKVDWVQLGGDPDRVRALVVGQAAATIASVEHDPIVKRAGGKILAVAARELPNWTRFTLITSEKVIKERPGDLVKALVAQAKGIRYAMNPQNPNGDVSAAALTWMQELNLKAGRQKTLLPVERVATWDFQKTMLAELGEVK